MDRATVLDWFRQHPEVVRGDPEEIVSRCERAVRRHAREDAWLAAKRYVSERRRAWEASHGGHASEAFVVREVCRELSDALRRHEPEPHGGDEDHLAGGPVKAALESDGWRVLVPWILEVAREAEHEAWDEIVRHTRAHAEELIARHHLSSDTDFDRTRCYGDVAALVAGILARDYSEHAFPRSPQGR